MGTRELLILILGLAVVAVLLRGLYVALRARRGQIRLAIDKNIPQDVDLEELELAELPSGGARVVKRSLASVNHQNALQNELDLDAERDGEQAVPMLLDTVEIRQQPTEKTARRGLAQQDRSRPSQSQRRDGVEPSRSRADITQSPHLDDEELPVDPQPQTPSLGDDLDAGFAPELDESAGTVGPSKVTRTDRVQDPLAGKSGVTVSEDWDDFADASDTADASEQEELPEAAVADTETAQIHDTTDYSEADSTVEEAFDDWDADDLDDDRADREAAYQDQDEEAGEPDFENDFEDELDEFHISADDRIGAPEAGSGFRNRAGADSPVENAYRGTRKAGLFSRFTRKSPPTVRGSRDEIDDDASDPLFTAQPSKPAEAGRPEPAARVTRTVASEAPSVKAAKAPAEGSAGVTDFNQARETRRPANPDTSPPASTSAPKPRDIEPGEVLVVNVMSREGEVFRGEDLLQVLVAAGLKHGEMNIFHRHIDNSAAAPIVFSVANILNPGTFELDKIQEFRTRGVSLFLAMPAVISNRDAFEDMLRTAKQIRSALDGELRDDHRHLMTAQTIEHYRQRIHDYELRKLRAAQARP